MKIDGIPANIEVPKTEYVKVATPGDTVLALVGPNVSVGGNVAPLKLI